MAMKSLKILVLILAIGLVLSLIVCLLANIIMTPSITEHEFPYSVTYELNGETKILEGVYKCTYEGFREGENPRDRYYTGEFIIDSQSTYAHTYTIAEKDGAELYIVTWFNDCYLMNDTKDEGYVPFLEDPYLESVDKEGCELLPEDRPSEFTAEIISWEYPTPIKNNFVFGGFSILHTGSMVAMLVIGLLTILACVIFVKRDRNVPYKVLDKLSVALNCIICLVVIPFIALITALLQITVRGDELMYQIYLCIPALTAFTIAISIALRRHGFTKFGFFLQFIGPVLFFLPALMGAI